MSAWSEVRRLARERHKELAGSGEDLVAATLLLEAATRATGVRRVACPHGDPLLDGAEAAYDHDRKKIYYARETASELANFHITHEFGHHWLDEAGAICNGGDLDVAVPAEPSMSLVGEADAYSPKERAEAQANLFAREFLLPREKLRRRCMDGKSDAALIAAELGVPADLVMQQMADALLLPEEREGAAEPRKEQTPDDSQLIAISAEPGPRQIRAGPGTGKTRTLVGRIAHLVSIGEDPHSILALTYSNLSAQDLAGRIKAAIGDKATAVWAGTFHAYGLELLRKYGYAIGLPAAPALLDRTDSLMLLLELLPELDLNYYLDLREPALKLRSILGAIGRAKDELKSPQEYERYALGMRDAASDDSAIEKAARALEVARAYAVYEKTLRERGQVDFGDLVARSVELLRTNPNIRDTARAEKRHVLVDEYQDMNRASGMLLREIVAPDQGPWVVGDVRQAIYRFRGASPLNMLRFGDDFPDSKTTDLGVNYRSGGRIVRAFESFGHHMAAAKLASKDRLIAHRGETTGTVVYEIATTREAEAEGIAQFIRARVAAGDQFGDHAILARSHTILARLARHLERTKVPCLYFGDFFERAEIRDLLALISLVAEPRGVGLLRVAQMPHYAIPPADIAVIFAWRRGQQITMLAAVRRHAEIKGLSDEGRTGMQRLCNDVSFVDWPMSAHRFLMCYLFGRCDHLQRLLCKEGVAGQQHRLAVYQLLQFAFAFKPREKGDPKRAFLEHVRWLEVLDEEKQLRQLPAAASDIDAVRLMTVHASKGLEFANVHITSLAKGQFPARSQPEACPPPVGMISPDDLMTREAEEESLFFVGMSRARDALHLSRALTNGKVSCKNPSPFLGSISQHLSGALEGAAGWTFDGEAEPPHPQLLGQPAEGEWTDRSIETYLDCPRRFYYEHVLVLEGGNDSSPFLKFQSALHASLTWLRETASAGARRDGIGAQFETDWIKWGPRGHPHELLYRTLAKHMIDNAVAVMGGESLSADLSLKLPETWAIVRCRADHVQSSPKGIVIRRLKASRLAKEETEKARYVLWQAAVNQEHPDSNIDFEHVSLLSGERRASTLDQRSMKKRLTIYDGVVRDVAAGNFDPNPGPGCPTCPYYFVCPSHGATR